MANKIIFIFILFIDIILCLSNKVTFECNKIKYTKDLNKICDFSQSSFDLLKQCMGDQVSSCFTKSKIDSPKEFCNTFKNGQMESCIFYENKIKYNNYICQLNNCLDKIDKFSKY